MKAGLLISIAAFTVACDGSRQARTDSSAKSTGGPPPAVPAVGTSNATVTLVGCLHGPSVSAAPGLAETAVRERASEPSAETQPIERSRRRQSDRHVRLG